MLRFRLCAEDRKRYGLGDGQMGFDAASLEDIDADALIALEEFLDINLASFQADLEALVKQRSARALKALLWLGARAAGCTTALAEFNPMILKAEIEDGGEPARPPANRAERRARPRKAQSPKPSPS